MDYCFSFELKQVYLKKSPEAALTGASGRGCVGLITGSKEAKCKS